VSSRTVAPAVLVAALVTIGCTRDTPAAAPPGQDGWYTFDGAWSATGARHTLPIDPAGRVAAIVQLAGAVAITTDDWIGRGFHGELIGFDDGHARSTGRWVWTDDRGDRVFGDVGGDPIQAGRRFVGTITGGSGRYAGISGQVEFIWQYLVEADDGVVQGRATGIRGRYRRGGGQP